MVNQADLLSSMKSVMIFDPIDSEQEIERKWESWWKHNKQSAVADKYVPSVEETRKMLNAK